ncbi:TIGR00730 family Rossman fold protein [Mesorhizobium opportunistum]|uniref:Cytokinin riboside 5'-monophosphate phosphoribohydrolase n=1 Tax=Mesorhizobium opportunistum TaxID=593909 RepID=A0ABV1YBI3_9HYPH|nr:TIGR00730 family Rossman fold protein [Mesorhizobium sp.]
MTAPLPRKAALSHPDPHRHHLRVRRRQAAAALGSCIGTAGIRLVYGGGSEGLMGAVAAAAAGAGGEVIAVVPQFLLERMRMPNGIAQIIAVPDMHMRKRLMFDYADAFVAMPGGIGTIEELAEVMTWRKLDRHQKPILIANFHDFWSPWLDLLDHLQEAGFLSGQVSTACLVADMPEAMLPMLQRGVCFPQVSLWQGRTSFRRSSRGAYPGTRHSAYKSSGRTIDMKARYEAVADQVTVRIWEPVGK